MNLEIIENKIYLIRGHRVMLDFDLAVLYEVETKRLKEAVRRNIERFPDDFMFELTENEFEILRTQIATSKSGGTRYAPFAFTEQGVAMLSAVLKSKKALDVSIAIMRVFVEIRKAVLFQSEILSELKDVKQRLGEHDTQLNSIYDAIEDLLDKKAIEQTWEDRNRIGFNKS